MGAQRELRRTRNLRQLLAGLNVDLGAGVVPDIEISDLSLDSRSILPGAAFVALLGLRTHGIGFAAQAVQAGARVVLWEPAASVAPPRLPDDVVLVAIPDLTRQLGTIADRHFNAPSQSMRIAGVTGTNGKTTTAYVLAAALERLEQPSAYAGTLGYGRVASLQSGTHTTPDCVTVHRQLAELRDDGVRFLGMEVSSHALDQHRVGGVRFDTAVFTNLTRDHLDYHGTFEAYGAAKARLFEWPQLRHAVINIDDSFGVVLASRRAAGTVATTCTSTHPGMQMPPGVRPLFAREIVTAPRGLQIQIDGAWGSGVLRSRFVGRFNVDNLLAVLASLLGWDVPLRSALAVLEECTAPPGRMETFIAAGKPLAIVDYAHTPDALEKALSAVREHCKGKITCVFGCGGDRDPGKRPQMGAIAQRLADTVIITDDNPRGEDGDVIVAGILAGLPEPQRAIVERDRAAAIERAIREAGANDAVLIAGKGHEDYQIVAGERRHFSDREVALAALGRQP